MPYDLYMFNKNICKYIKKENHRDSQSRGSLTSRASISWGEVFGEDEVAVIQWSVLLRDAAVELQKSSALARVR